MIIPKQFLKTIKRTGLGINLFDEMRYTPDGKEIPDFVLDRQAPVINARRFGIVRTHARHAVEIVVTRVEEGWILESRGRLHAAVVPVECRIEPIRELRKAAVEAVCATAAAVAQSLIIHGEAAAYDGLSVGKRTIGKSNAGRPIIRIRREDREVRIERDGIGLSQTLQRLRREIRAWDDELTRTEVEIRLRFVTLLPSGLNHVPNAVAERETRRNLPIVLQISAVTRVIKQVYGARCGA